jgi:hypothetical protein
MTTRWRPLASLTRHLLTPCGFVLVYLDSHLTVVMSCVRTCVFSRRVASSTVSVATSPCSRSMRTHSKADNISRRPWDSYSDDSDIHRRMRREQAHRRRRKVRKNRIRVGQRQLLHRQQRNERRLSLPVAQLQCRCGRLSLSVSTPSAKSRTLDDLSSPPVSIPSDYSYLSNFHWNSQTLVRLKAHERDYLSRDETQLLSCFAVHASKKMIAFAEYSTELRIVTVSVADIHAAGEEDFSQLVLR